MAVHTPNVTVTTSATALNSTSRYTTVSGDKRTSTAASIYNDGAVVCYIGGSDVTTSGATKGLPLYPGASMDIDGSEVFYGRVVTGTCNIIILEVGA